MCDTCCKLTKGCHFCLLDELGLTKAIRATVNKTAHASGLAVAVDLTEVDGLGVNTILTVLSETGPDLASKFATEKHFASWTTLAPRKHQSGKRVRYPAQCASRVAKAFRLAARALLSSKSVMGNFLRRLRARLGVGSAIRATACKLAKLFYRLITKGEAYRRESTAQEEAKYRERQMRVLQHRAAELGMKVVPAV